MSTTPNREDTFEAIQALKEGAELDDLTALEQTKRVLFFFRIYDCKGLLDLTRHDLPCVEHLGIQLVG